MMKAYEIPEGGRQARGMAIVNLLNLEKDESVSAIIPIDSYNPKENLIFVTRQGITKRTELSQLKNIRKNGIIAITLKDNDELISVRRTDGNKELIVVTKKGMAIRFDENDVRAMGRNAAGVKAITLNDGDIVVAADLVKDNNYLVVITELGFGKKTPLEEYRTQIRGGKGVITYNIKDKTGDIVSAKVIDKEDEIMMISLSGTIIRIKGEDISTMGRSTQGVTLMKMNDDKVVAVAKYVED